MFPEEKVCGGCSKKRPLTDFPKDRSKKDGRHTRCKDCKTYGPSRSGSVKKKVDPDDVAKRRALVLLVERHRPEYLELVELQRHQMGMAPMRPVRKWMSAGQAF